MKKMKRLISFISVGFLCFCNFSACEEDRIIGRLPKYTHPEFQTEYTIEEHIERIEKRTQEKFFEEILTGKISDIEVEILYAFHDNDPEYFMVQLRYTEDFEGESWMYEKLGDGWYGGYGRIVEYQTRYKHFIGFIENDEYYSRLPAYVGLYDGDVFVDGRNPYELSGYSNAKKYCGYEICAVEVDGEMLQIFNARNLHDSGVEFDGFEERFDQRIIPEEEQKELMKCHPTGGRFAVSKSVY
ncbi:MAG: hypothetical protein J6B56_01900 [Clostridia bacterium]|nr:hypothetical protein [Clostridia bacterium]